MHVTRSLALAALVAPLAFSTSASAASMSMAPATCASITKALMVSEGFTNATGPQVTPYNYADSGMNATNAVGTTIDFGAKAIVIGCVSPSDIAKSGSAKQTAQQYMDAMVKDSAGAMIKTPVAGVNDYLDFGNGKQDGLGSTSKMLSVRLDAWVAGKYVFFGFSGPVRSPKPSPALVNFIKWTEKNY